MPRPQATITAIKAVCTAFDEAKASGAEPFFYTVTAKYKTGAPSHALFDAIKIKLESGRGFFLLREPTSLHGGSITLNLLSLGLCGVGYDDIGRGAFDRWAGVSAVQRPQRHVCRECECHLAQLWSLSLYVTPHPATTVQAGAVLCRETGSLLFAAFLQCAC